MVPFSYPGVPAIQCAHQGPARKPERRLGAEVFEIPRLVRELVKLRRCEAEGFVEAFEEGLKGSVGGYSGWTFVDTCDVGGQGHACIV